MDKHMSVEIYQVANGFIVHPTRGVVDQAYFRDLDSVFCFDTFASLSDWLDQHFAPKEQS